MTKRKTSSKQTGSSEVAEQLEHAFLAGLGAMANTQKAGSKAFEALIEQGKSFRKETSNKTESLIDEVQDAILRLSPKLRTVIVLRYIEGLPYERIAEAPLMGA